MSTEPSQTGPVEQGAPEPSEETSPEKQRSGLGGALLGALGSLAAEALDAAGRALTTPARTDSADGEAAGGSEKAADGEEGADGAAGSEEQAAAGTSEVAADDQAGAGASGDGADDEAAAGTSDDGADADATVQTSQDDGPGTPSEGDEPSAEQSDETAAAPQDDEPAAAPQADEPAAAPQGDEPAAAGGSTEAADSTEASSGPGTSSGSDDADAPDVQQPDAVEQAPAEKSSAEEASGEEASGEAETAAEVTPEPQADPVTEPATEDQTATPAPAAPSAPAASSGPSPAAPSPAALPRPGRRPKKTAPAAPATVTPPLAVGAAAFGRVDEAGTVHVRDGDTEREVGQYPDVPEAEAIAFYVRKFEDLAGQVHLLGQRLDNGTVPAKEARSSLAGLREQSTDAKAVGDLPALRAELDRLDSLVAERTAAEDAQRAEARAKALAEREAIVAEAEQIAATPPASMHFKNAGERMQVLLDTWKTAQRSGTRLDKRTEDPLWKRFAAARSTVDRLRRAHFSQVSEQRTSTKQEKEQLIVRAEELQTSTDWRATSDEYRSLMDRWKAAGRLSRKDDDALWARFRAAQDVFFANRTAANSAQDEEYRGNLTVKEALAAEAEALLPVTDVAAAKRQLTSIQDRWDEAGRVPRDSLDQIEGRLRAVIEKVRDADSARWGKSTPDVVQRGSGLVLQLRQQVADLDTKVSEAEGRGDSRTAQRAAKERDTKRAWLAQAESSLDDLSR